jgi:hypothetical protein
MNLQNGYKVIYEKTADGKRTFYATKNVTCNPEVDDKIVEAEIGKYRLIYEKGGRFYGSESGIPAEGDCCFEGFDKVFVETKEEPVEEPTKEPVEEPVIETPEEVEGGEF